MSKTINDEDFEQEVLKSEKLVLVDFWAEWCGPCRMLGPVIDQISEELSNKVDVFKMNVDNNPNTPSKYGVRGIPSLMLFKDGKLLDSRVGALPKAGLITWIESHT